MQCRWRPLSPLFLSFNRRVLSTHAPVVLRPYQEICLTTCTDALASGSTRIGVSLPTGSGKTTVFVSLLSRIAPPPNNVAATRSLIVVNSIELAHQSAEQVKRMFPEWHVEIEQGAKHQASGTADVTIATYQTLNNEQRLMKFDSKMFKAIIIDEAHHAAAPSYRRVLSKFHNDIKHPDGLVIDELPHKTPIIGFSATFSRHDGIALGSVFERIVYHRDFLEMIKEQWLCDIRFTSVKAQLDLSKVPINSVNKDFSTTGLASVMNSESMNNVVVRSWIDRASERKSTLVFCVNIAHVVELTKAFRSYGVDARYIFAATPPAERKELVSAFRQGDFPVLVNCAILTEGADIPNIDCVVLARPTRSRNIFAQMVGRGMRLSPTTGKTDCRVIDFVDSHNRVGGVVSLPNLFGLDPGELDIDDETIDTLRARIQDRSAEHHYNMLTSPDPPQSRSPKSGSAIALEDLPNPFSVTYTDHDDAFGMVEEPSGTEQSMSSPYAWVNCGAGIWVLELHRQGFLRLEPDDADPTEGSDPPAKGILYKARYTAANSNPSIRQPFWAPRTLFSGLALAPAIRACDNYVQTKLFKDSTAVLRSTAAWRKLPATPAQRNIIIKRQKSHPDVEPLSDSTALTKGQAATIITRLIHGAGGRHKKNMQEKVRALKKAKKEEMRVDRELVRVGVLPNL